MKSGMGGPIAVATILATTVAVNFGVLYVADHDPSFVIEKDYYQKAVHYDEEIDQELRNQQLGWNLSSSVAPIGSTGSDVNVRLTDAGGRPLTGATVRVSALFNARAADVLDATLSAPPGSNDYSARLPMRYAGEWELRFEAIHGADHFTAVRRFEVPAAGGGRS